MAANAALVSLTGNPDTHFGIVNEGAAPALVATLQYGKAAVGQTHRQTASREQMCRTAHCLDSVQGSACVLPTLVTIQ